MITYPKIETLYDRDATFKIIPGRLRLPEYALITAWHLTEKIDGTNIRVELAPDGTVTYRGRTDEAQLHASLVAWLQERLPREHVASVFDPGARVVLFGEGYGPKIQSGGMYGPAVAFRLFDVAVFGANERLWWLNWPNVQDVAAKLGIATVPVLRGQVTLTEALHWVLVQSATAQEDGGAGGHHEGIVARTEPLLLTRAGERLMWKLKLRDFSREGLAWLQEQR